MIDRDFVRIFLTSGQLDCPGLPIARSETVARYLFDDNPGAGPGTLLESSGNGPGIGTFLQKTMAYIMVNLLDSNGGVISGYGKDLCYFQDEDDFDLPLAMEWPRWKRPGRPNGILAFLYSRCPGLCGADQGIVPNRSHFGIVGFVEERSMK